MTLAEKIRAAHPESDEVAVFYLAQAGFYFKSATGKTLCLDPYLSDCCERMFGFKRMIPSVMRVRELEADFLVSTHSHADHLDPDLLDCVKTKRGMRFIGSPDCLPIYEKAGLPHERITILAAGESRTLDGIEFRAVYADHGALAPEAGGILINLDGITIYDTGDTSYCPDKLLGSLGDIKVDILLVPINPAFGNPGHENACNLAALIKPDVVIGCHFGMFTAHGGDPGAFLENAAKSLPQSIASYVMAPGEQMLYSRARGIISTETLKL